MAKGETNKTKERWKKIALVGLLGALAIAAF
jgi:hypothetical protein